jgi:DNA-binding PadR family transcriptional regulator
MVKEGGRCQGHEHSTDGDGHGAIPLLHGMEKRGWLESERERVGGRSRRVYMATRTGRDAPKSGRERVRELFEELTEDEA